MSYINGDKGPFGQTANADPAALRRNMSDVPLPHPTKTRHTPDGRQTVRQGGPLDADLRLTVEIVGRRAVGKTYLANAIADTVAGMVRDAPARTIGWSIIERMPFPAQEQRPGPSDVALERVIAAAGRASLVDSLIEGAQRHAAVPPKPHTYMYGELPTEDQVLRDGPSLRQPPGFEQEPPPAISFSDAMQFADYVLPYRGLGRDSAVNVLATLIQRLAL